MIRIALAAALMVCATACTKSQPASSNVVAAAPPQSAQATTTAPAPKNTVEVSDQTTKLQVGSDVYEFRKHIHAVRGAKSPDDSTVEWWELRDASGKVIVHTDYGAPKVSALGDFEETEDVSARTFHADGGDGILVEGGSLPSAPRSGTWVQLFARPWGSKPQPVQSFGPPISTDGEFKAIAIDHRRDPQPRPGLKVISLHDVLQFNVWTGNFDIEYPALINWISGRIEPAMRCLRTTAKGQVERCEYPIHPDSHRDAKDLTFVRLFVEPEEGIGTPEHVVIKPDSKIEFLAAEVPVTWQSDANNTFISAQGNDGEMWVHVRIDGREGWIHTQEDFQAVGLPQSG